ncbi:MAG: hypothetical protein R8J84_05680 [Mariprofundales bacterium]
MVIYLCRALLVSSFFMLCGICQAAPLITLNPVMQGKTLLKMAKVS